MFAVLNHRQHKLFTELFVEKDCALKARRLQPQNTKIVNLVFVFFLFS